LDLERFQVYLARSRRVSRRVGAEATDDEELLPFDSETQLTSEIAGERLRVVELVWFDHDRNDTPENRSLTE